MFVHSWPLWANVIILAVILIVKWLIIKYVEKSTPYSKSLVGKGWIAVASIGAGVNALVTYVLLFPWVGSGWSLAWAIVDGVIHWLISYWQRKHQLPVLSEGNLSTAKAWWKDIRTWVSAIPVGTYTSIASWIVSYGSTHRESISKLFSLIVTFITSKA